MSFWDDVGEDVQSGESFVIIWHIDDVYEALCKIQSGYQEDDPERPDLKDQDLVNILRNIQDDYNPKDGVTLDLIETYTRDYIENNEKID
jgi:hypothetical protein